MPLQARLNRLWYDTAAPPGWLRALAALFGVIVRLRRWMYRVGLRRTALLSAPVIIVGNLSVGGTGKTPLVIWLANRLRESGLRPGIATRGYGGSARQPRLIAVDEDPGIVGDEPLLLSRRTGAPVAIGRDRPAAARLLIAAGCDVVISDDGLQHYALPRACELVVVDGVRRFGNGWMLPAGPLREPVARLGQCDAVIVNGGPPATGDELQMRLEAQDAVALQGGAVVPLGRFAGRGVHAVAGIGNPERFFRMLTDMGLAVTAHALDDHARLKPADIRFGDDKPVLMTEKDAVKCLHFGTAGHWCVPVVAVFAPADAAVLLARVQRAIGRRPL